MGESELNTQISNMMKLLLWSALLLSLLPSQRLRLMPMLMLSTDTTDMLHMPMDTELMAMATHTDMGTMERDLPMLSQRPRLMLLSCMELMDMLDMLDTHMPLVDTEPMDTHTPMDTMERDLLMLSQRLMLMLSTDTTDTDHMAMDTELMAMDTPDLDTTERDLLILSPRLRLMLMPTTMVDMPMELTPMPMEPTLMELTHTDMDMPGESKLIQRNLSTNNKNQKLTANIIRQIIL